MHEDELVQWILRLMAENCLHEFYISKCWVHLRSEVLAEYKGECQWCRKRGLYVPADTVHHVQFIRKHPRLALSKTYVYNGKVYINLLPLCRKCHELAHPERRKTSNTQLLTPERW